MCPRVHVGTLSPCGERAVSLVQTTHSCLSPRCQRLLDNNKLAAYIDGSPQDAHGHLAVTGRANTGSFMPVFISNAHHSRHTSYLAQRYTNRSQKVRRDLGLGSRAPQGSGHPERGGAGFRPGPGTRPGHSQADALRGCWQLGAVLRGDAGELAGLWREGREESEPAVLQEPSHPTVHPQCRVGRCPQAPHPRERGNQCALG